MNSLGITQANMSHLSATGSICFTGLPFTPHNAVATVDASGGGGAPGPYVQVHLGTGGGTCPFGTQLSVFTLNNNVFGNYAFYLLVH